MEELASHPKTMNHLYLFFVQCQLHVNYIEK